MGGWREGGKGKGGECAMSYPRIFLNPSVFFFFASCFVNTFRFFWQCVRPGGVLRFFQLQRGVASGGRLVYRLRGFLSSRGEVGRLFGETE